jgi:sugar phosphate isomerase/epimerase
VYVPVRYHRPVKEYTVRIGFMSSAAPNWDLATLLREGRASGCTALEPRVEWGHGHGLERDTPEAWSAAQRRSADAGMVISAVALGTRLNRPTPEERRQSVEDIAAYAELAAAAGASVLRVFGGPMAPGWTMEQARPLVAEALAAAAERCSPYHVIPCLETHDAFWHPDDVAWCIEHAGHVNVGATWHAAHHVRRGISVDAAFAVLAPWVRHVHIQEVPPAGSEFQPSMAPVPLGDGDGSVHRQITLLAGQGYAGTLSLEWINNKEHPLDPGPPLRQYGTTMQRWLADIGGRTPASIQ